MHQNLNTIFRQGEKKEEGLEHINKSILNQHYEVFAELQRDFHYHNISPKETFSSLFPSTRLITTAQEVTAIYNNLRKQRINTRPTAEHLLSVGLILKAHGATEDHIEAGLLHDLPEDLLTTTADLDIFFTTGTLHYNTTEGKKSYVLPQRIRPLVENTTNVVSVVFEEIQEEIKNKEQDMNTLKKLFAELKNKTNSQKIILSATSLELQMYHAYFKSEKETEKEKISDALRSFRGTRPKYKLYLDIYERTNPQNWVIKYADAIHNELEPFSDQAKHKNLRRANKTVEMIELYSRHQDKLSPTHQFFTMSLLESLINKYKNPSYKDLSGIPPERDLQKYTHMIKDNEQYIKEREKLLRDYKKNEAENYINTLATSHNKENRFF
jgi:hypothetical protein